MGQLAPCLCWVASQRVQEAKPESSAQIPSAGEVALIRFLPCGLRQ